MCHVFFLCVWFSWRTWCYLACLGCIGVRFFLGFLCTQNPLLSGGVWMKQKIQNDDSHLFTMLEGMGRVKNENNGSTGNKQQNIQQILGISSDIYVSFMPTYPRGPVKLKLPHVNGGSWPKPKDHFILGPFFFSISWGVLCKFCWGLIYLEISKIKHLCCVVDLWERWILLSHCFD